MNRIILKLLAGAALLLVAAASFAHTCDQHAVYGAIGDRYRQLGGEAGPLGCPLSDEAGANNGGRFNQFEHGQITWAPRQGSGMTIAAWQAGDSVWLEWGQTDIHFDKFLVRYDYQHQNIGQDDWAPGNGGRYQLNATRPGNYGFSVQGCNGDCQGWDKTVEVFVDVADPRGVNGGLQVVSTGILPGMRQTLFSNDRFFLDAFNRAWSLARGPLCDAIKSQAGGADALGPGYTLHPDMFCKLAPSGLLFLDDASGASGAVDVTFDVPHNYFEATTTQPSVLGSYADPRFSFTFEIALHMRLDPVNLKVQSVDYAVINASKPDSHNAAADVMNIVGPIVAPSVLRRARIAVDRSGSINVDRLNDALQAGRDAVASNLQGHTPSYAIDNGNVRVTLAGPVPATAKLNANVGAQEMTRKQPMNPPAATGTQRMVHAPPIKFRRVTPASASSSHR
ncbi:MAG: hypothetical protein ABI132_02550 [Rhodanobacteraceae bacterium]